MSDETRRLTAEHQKRCERDRLDLLLKAAKWLNGRDRAKCRDVLDAMGLNRTQTAYATADRIMAAGGYTRLRGEYRKTHNAELSR